MSSCGSASCDASGSLAKRRLPFLFGKGLDLPPHCERPQYLRQGQVLPLPRTTETDWEHSDAREACDEPSFATPDFRYLQLRGR